jgi:hypothetical protein
VRVREMADMVISEMDLPRWIANIFAARNIITAKVNYRISTSSFPPSLADTVWNYFLFC